ncbi:MAG: hypothetical protein P4L34_07260 [Paludibacter sp.]|nr:hypothetical protein [Paludibacter sp.]
MGDAKVSTNFSTGKYTDTGLSTKTSYVVEKMTGNTLFATPTPSLKEITDANTNYMAALGKVQYGSKEDTVIKNNLRAALVVLLKQLADYVQTTSNGDEAVILSSGLDITKKPTTVGVLDKPVNFTVKPGKNKSTIMASCDKVDSANYYEVEFTETPVTATSVWRQRTSTKSKMDIDGFISGVEYAFRMCGAGSNPARVWSDIINSFIL